MRTEITQPQAAEQSIVAAGVSDRALSGVRSSSRRRPLTYYLEAYALLGLLVGAVLFFSIWPRTSDTFLSTANMQVLIGGSTAIAVVALGSLVPLVCNEWDLSIGANAGLSSIFVATALTNGATIGVAILIGLAVGVAIGLANALLVTRLHVNAVITTLGVSIILGGIVSLKTQGQGVSGSMPLEFIEFGTQNWLGVPRTAYALALVAAVVYYLLCHTPYGRYLYAMGSSRSAAKLVGIRTRLVLATSFVIGGALCALGGVLLVARSGGADPRVGDLLTLPALAAAFLSAAAIKPGHYNVFGTLVAVYFIAVLNSGLSLAGAADYVSSFVNGGALIVGVALAVRLGAGRRTP
jgi:ribose transport system permease protein